MNKFIRIFEFAQQLFSDKHTAQQASEIIKPMVLLHRLNSAIERRITPFSSGFKPFHWANRIKAAIVNAKRALKYSQTR